MIISGVSALGFGLLSSFGIRNACRNTTAMEDRGSYIENKNPFFVDLLSNLKESLGTSNLKQLLLPKTLAGLIPRGAEPFQL
jgi:hypothetical protein